MLIRPTSWGRSSASRHTTWRGHAIRLLTSFLKRASLVGLATLAAAQASFGTGLLLEAQAGAAVKPHTSNPFTCATPTSYLGAANPTQLYDSLLGAGSASFSKVGTTHGWNYGAMGYDPSTKYLYAISNTSTNKAYPAGRLLKIGVSGLVQNLGEITGDSYLTTNGATNGSFDGNNFWVTSPGNAYVDEVSVTTTPPAVSKQVM